MVPEKNKKKPWQEQVIKVSRIAAQGKKKKIMGKKIKGYAVSGQKKTKNPP